MKNIFKLMILSLMVTLLNSCESQINISPEKVSSILKSGEFTFMAQRANPVGNDVQKALRGMPNANAANILNLESGYTLKISEDELISELPYFGRMYSPNYDRDKFSYRFVSTDFTVNETPGKKGRIVYTILAKDQANIRKMELEVYENGRAYLYIDANDRQGISYDGYITENLIPKVQAKN